MADHVAHIMEQWSVERPDLDVSPIGIIGRLHRLAARLTEELNVVYRRFGLGEGDFDVLVTLRRQGGDHSLTCSALAESTMVTSGGMTKRIDRLEAAGLVRRRESTADGRSRPVQLTAAGHDLVDEAFAAHIANEHRLVATLDPADRVELTAILGRWLSDLEAGPTARP